MSLNKVMLIGHAGKDPEIRYVGSVSNGTKCATFSLATTEKYRASNGEVKEITEWHNIVVWRSLADVVEKYVRKGTQVFIEGKIKSRVWDDALLAWIYAGFLTKYGGKTNLYCKK